MTLHLRFYVMPAVEQQSRAVRACMRNGTLDSAYSQFLFELDVYAAALTHPLRTFRLEDAAAVLLPALPSLSAKAGFCVESDHKQRMAGVASQVALLPPSLPLILTCTCVNQNGLMHGLYDVLVNRSKAHANVIQLAQARRPIPQSAADRVVVAPYFGGPSAPRRCERSGRQVFWAGSTAVGHAQAARVRRHILSFGAHGRFTLRESHRRGGGCPTPPQRLRAAMPTKGAETPVTAARGAPCIRGTGVEVGGGAHKRAMREEMAAHAHCLVRR